MKKLTLILILFFIGFTTLVSGQITYDSISIFDSTIYTSTTQGNRIINFGYEDDEGIKDIYWIDQVEDTLVIYRKWFYWEDNYGPGVGCLVNGCTSDHKIHYRDRILLSFEDDDITYFKREIGKLEDVEVKITKKEWRYDGKPGNSPDDSPGVKWYLKNE